MCSICYICSLSSFCASPLLFQPFLTVPQRQVSSEKVEHAIEEEPSEIYVKEELTLDIPFAVQVRAHSEMVSCL